MNIEQMLQQTNAIEAVSRELGVDPAAAKAGATALLPSILSGFQNPVQPAQFSGGGSDLAGLGRLGGLLGSIGALGGGGLLDNVMSNEPTQVDKGNEILGQLFGSKDGSRAVAASAAAQSGVEPALLKKMLPILAMIAAGYVMKKAGQGPEGLGGVLGDLLGKTSTEAATQGSPSSSGSGGVLDDLIGAAGKFLGR